MDLSSDSSFDKATSLEESETRLRAIFDTAGDGIITIDAQGEIQRVNTAVQTLFGYSADALIGKCISTLMPQKEKEEHDTYLSQKSETLLIRYTGRPRQVIGKKKDGTVFPFRLSVSEFKLGELTQYTGIVSDLSEEYSARERLNQLNDSLEEKVAKRTKELNDMVIQMQEWNEKLLEEASKRAKAEAELKVALEKEKELHTLKSRFVALASHEFRTPLNGILSSAALIAKYPKEDQQDKRVRHVDRINWAVGHLTSILDEFLSVERLRAGRVKVHPTTFALSDLIEEMKENATPMLTDHKTLLCLHSGVEGEVRQDKSLLRSILLNLLSNAFKYAGEDLEIELRSHLDEETLTLEVADDGIGIPAEEQHHLFERFYRASNTTGVRGTGLGLDIALDYADLLHGEISFDSTEGVGTTFRVRVPRYIELKEEEVPE